MNRPCFPNCILVRVRSSKAEADGNIRRICATPGCEYEDRIDHEGNVIEE